MKTLNNYINEALIKKDTKIQKVSKLKNNKDTFDRVSYLLLTIYDNNLYNLIKNDYDNNISNCFKNELDKKTLDKLLMLIQTEFNDSSITLEDIFIYIENNNDELLKDYEDWRLD